MGSSCSTCQAENQSILSDTISPPKKFKSNEIQKKANEKKLEFIELEPQLQFQMCPNKQYSGDTHPELELQGQDDMILDLSDEFFASTNIQEKQDKENLENSICQESWSQITIFSNFRQQSSNPYEHQKGNFTTFLKQYNQNEKQMKNNNTKVSFETQNQLDNSKKKQQKQKQQNQIDSLILKNFSFNNFEHQQEKFFQEKICHSYQIISILKTPKKRRFRSMTPQKKHVRFNLSKQKKLQ